MTPAPDPPDEELLRRIIRKDPEAMRVLYQRHGRVVYGVALAVLGNAGEAEEVTQDVFLRAWEKAESYQPEKARVVTWLARIARNRSIDVLRQASARITHVSESGASLDLLADTTTVDPGESAELTWRRHTIRDAMDTLPTEQRRALSLAFLQGLTHREIAERLGEPLGTVKTRIRDAMHRLRDVLESEKP
jgi:RNA polymerase sigma-70 factor (ECF subfamily)